MHKGLTALVAPQAGKQGLGAVEHMLHPGVRLLFHRAGSGICSAEGVRRGAGQREKKAHSQSRARPRQTPWSARRKRFSGRNNRFSHAPSPTLNAERKPPMKIDDSGLSWKTRPRPILLLCCCSSSFGAFVSAPAFDFRAVIILDALISGAGFLLCGD